MREIASSFRLKLSATGKLAIGPVRIDASNTYEASSMSFDLVYDTRKRKPVSEPLLQLRL